MRFAALPGFRDVYPDQFARRRRIVDAWRSVATRFGFEEYDGPPLEPLELYTAKSGEEIVGQLYSFADKGGRQVALRPEMTPTLARMIAARAGQLRKPIRWFSIPQLFRYERQQRGRLREHLQLNVDIAGEPGPAADGEVIAVAVAIMQELGLTPADVGVRVSDRRILDHVLRREGVRAEEMGGVFAALDKLDRSREAARELAAAALGNDTARADAVLAVVDALGGGGVLVRDEVSEDLFACEEHVHRLGLGDYFVRDLRIVRGLAYYTGIVFELFDAQRSLRAICGGGRYDQLVEQLGGPSLPCVGFGMGDVVLGELLADREGPAAAARALDIFVATVTEAEVPEGLRLAQALRGRGYRVEYALRRQALGRQLELANARGARWAVVLGPDERAAGVAVVRALGAGSEERVPLAVLARDYVFGEGS
jgi:histidyl-tRNA synthetase